jgi:3-oxoacyl-[acyl-carrier protein] reductase
MKRRVLVTGASQGIGRAVALALAGNGFDVTVHCRSNRAAVEDLCVVVRDRGGRSDWLQFDVGDRAATAAALENDVAAHGAFYGIVCNAGVHRDAAFPAMSGEEWDEVLRTNLDGFYNVVQPCVMPMVRARDGGRIVVMSSVSGLMGNRGQVNYSAAKAGLVGAAKALAVELAKRRITVNCIAPGLIATEMTAEIDDEMVTQMVPMRRMGTADEVADLVAYLFSERAGYVTRQVISINGGMF